MARLDGTTQNDQLIWNEAGSVEIYGFAGDDTLWGDAGNDFLVGGSGSDVLLGGVKYEDNQVFYSCDRLLL